MIGGFPSQRASGVQIHKHTVAIWDIYRYLPQHNDSMCHSLTSYKILQSSSSRENNVITDFYDGVCVYVQRDLSSMSGHVCLGPRLLRDTWPIYYFDANHGLRLIIPEMNDRSEAHLNIFLTVTYRYTADKFKSFMPVLFDLSSVSHSYLVTVRYSLTVTARGSLLTKRQIFNMSSTNFGAAPKSEWSTNSLPTKVWFILVIWDNWR